MKYHYLVVYYGKENNSFTKTEAIGRTEITTDKKIKTFSEIEKIEEILEKEIKINNAIILNYILLRGDKK